VKGHYSSDSVVPAYCKGLCSARNVCVYTYLGRHIQNGSLHYPLYTICTSYSSFWSEAGKMWSCSLSSTWCWG